MLSNKIFELGYFPEKWSEGYIIPIFKKGDTNEPSNYRGITLLSTLGNKHVRKSNRKAINRNWSNQRANPALKTKSGKNKYDKQKQYNEDKLLTERAAISQKVATQQPKLN